MGSSASDLSGPQASSPVQQTAASISRILPLPGIVEEELRGPEIVSMTNDEREKIDDEVKFSLETGDPPTQHWKEPVKMDCSSSESESPREDPDKGQEQEGITPENQTVDRAKLKRVSIESLSSKGSGNSTTPEMRTARTTPRLSSFDEKYKNKVSIYSKVSGCRMSNLPDYTIVKQIRVVILQHVTKGNPQEALGIKFAYEKMNNGGLQIITDDKRLSTALSSLSYFATIPCKMTFPNNPRVVGFVKNLPIDMEPADLKQEIRKQLPEVYSVRYITERAAGRSRPSQGPCAFISFNLRYLPKSIWVYRNEYEIQVPNPMQCTRCCRYGHQGKQCRAETRCPLCSNQHPKHQCGSSFMRCINCKGDHASTSHECSVWVQGKLMNELRYRGGMSAEEAINIASEGKIQHKKHSFIAPDEYFDNLESFYLGSEDGSPRSGNGGLGSDDETAITTMNRTRANTNNPDEPDLKSPRQYFHSKYIATQQFLDLMTDFYLRLTNPDENYTSTILMPEFDDDFMMQRLYKIEPKKPSLIAEKFKQLVQQAVEVDMKEDPLETPLIST